MRVLFATSFAYLPQRTGGSESSTHDLCTALIQNNVEVGVISALGMYDSLWISNRVISKLSGNKFIKDNRLPYPVFRGHVLKEGISEVIARFAPDVAVVQAGSPFEVVNCFSRLKVPVVLYARDVEFDRNHEELQLNRYVEFVANSQFTGQSLSKIFPISPLVLPPLVNPYMYKVNSRRETVLHVGLDEAKGIETSFALAARRPDIPFQFVESWPVSKNIFKTYEERALALKNIRIHRRSTDMKQFYESARILLVPSLWEEAWGRVVTEAQLSGIPVIASGRGGLPESVGAGGIILPREADIDEWEKALSRLWDSPNEYAALSEAAFSRSKQADISCEVIIDRFINFLQGHIRSVAN